MCWMMTKWWLVSSDIGKICLGSQDRLCKWRELMVNEKKAWGTEVWIQEKIKKKWGLGWVKKETSSNLSITFLPTRFPCLRYHPLADHHLPPFTIYHRTTTEVPPSITIIWLYLHCLAVPFGYIYFCITCVPPKKILQKLLNILCSTWAYFHPRA